jgi:hypothetical protein
MSVNRIVARMPEHTCYCEVFESLTFQPSDISVLGWDEHGNPLVYIHRRGVYALAEATAATAA